MVRNASEAEHELETGCEQDVRAKHPRHPCPSRRRRDLVEPVSSRAERSYRVTMNILFWIIIIVAVVLLVLGGLLEAVRFLLWVGIALVLIAVIAWLLRKISGKKR